MQCTLGELLLVPRANPKVMVNEGKKKDINPGDPVVF